MTLYRMGHLREAIHAGAAAAVARILEAHEEDVVYCDYDKDALVEHLRQGDIDILVSAWFPRDEAFANAGMTAIGSLYRPSCVWVASKTFLEISALTRDDVSSFLVARGCQSRFEKAIASLPLLKDIPTQFCEDEHLLARTTRVLGEQENAHVIFMQPHALIDDKRLHLVADPTHLLGAPLDAKLLLKSSLLEEMDPILSDELSEMSLGNRVVSALARAILVDEIAPEEAAEMWQRGRLVAR